MEMESHLGRVDLGRNQRSLLFCFFGGFLGFCGFLMLFGFFWDLPFSLKIELFLHWRTLDVTIFENFAMKPARSMKIGKREQARVRFASSTLTRTECWSFESTLHGTELYFRGENDLFEKAQQTLISGHLQYGLFQYGRNLSFHLTQSRLFSLVAQFQ